CFTARSPHTTLHTLSLLDALPICRDSYMTADLSYLELIMQASLVVKAVLVILLLASFVSWSIIFAKRRLIQRTKDASDTFEANLDRKSTRLNSSHVKISYAVFCLK